MVLTATLPRFLLTGDRGTMHLELDNVEGPAGEYSVAVRADGALNLGNQAAQKLRLAAKQRTSLTVPVSSSTAGAVGIAGADRRSRRLRAGAHLCAHR